ncbi:MAG: hypothetical protein HPY62_02005 [Bacteroidales bacterium]|nr:hypothetical protein [Bacteroidales bacterium]
MDFNSTIDLIVRDLNEAREIIDDLKKYPGVPAIQVELAKSKCKSAAEVIELLKEIKNSTAASAEVHDMNKPSPAGSVEVQKEEKVVMEEKPVTETPLKPEPAEVNVHIGTSEKEIIMTKPQAHARQQAQKQAVLADQFGHRANGINEQLGGNKHDDDILEIMKHKPVTSLKEAIGINDKFLFIREIFNGNSENYNSAIARLENVNCISEAREIISGYTGADSENEAVVQLLELVKRKLPSDE